jgi:hypothetical protein
VNLPFVYEVLDAWELLSDDARLQRYSVADWKKLSKAIDDGYPADAAVALGASHVGLSQGNKVARGEAPIQELALPLISSEKVWLPDPIFTFFSQRAADAWHLIPCSGSKYMTGKSQGRTLDEAFWTVQVDRRKPAILQRLPALLARLRELKPLVEAGAIGFLPWEPILLAQPEHFRTAANQLSTSPFVLKLTQRFPQIEYSLGPRSGPIGIQVGENQPPGSDLVPGTQMYLVEKRPMLLLGFLNAAYSRVTAASYQPSLRGDRVVYDFVRSGGDISGGTTTIAEQVALPRLASAAWPDIVGLRQNSRALNEFRSVVQRAGAVSEEQALPAIRAALNEAAEKLRVESSTWRSFKSEFVSTTIQTAISGAGGYIAAGTDAAFIAGLGAGAASLILSFARSRWNAERKQAEVGSEILISVAERLP